MHPQTRSRLEVAERRMAGARIEPMEVLFETLTQLRAVLNGERERHELLLGDVARDSATELHLAVALLVILPLAGGALAMLFRLRIKRPLDDLGDLLGRLASRDYRPVADATLGDAAGLVQPVFHSYNELVSRLQGLETEHLTREHTLEGEVRQATEALLAQSRELARAERLAAVGAVSAGLAHELRNPLAGIQMACSKLRRNLDDSDQAARIGAVLNELKRLNLLLTAKVEAARHQPETPARVCLGDLVDSLLTLTRYQTPPGIDLHSEVPPGLYCLLPAAGLRQALLNLLLNAIQFQDNEGQVTLSAQRRGATLALWVEDRGPGFSPQMLRAGVRPFATGRPGGAGLGLAMVRRFARDHDGELELANREPHGARVTLRLPCSIDDSDKPTQGL
jgi:signal transduction histidine kinase